jgi:hypothetical protein
MIWSDWPAAKDALKTLRGSNTVSVKCTAAGRAAIPMQP